MLKCDKNLFEVTVKIMNTLINKLGLFLNAGKNRAILLGTKTNSPNKYMPNLQIDQNPHQAQIFGMRFTNQ